MLYFESDYMAGAHEAVLESISRINLELNAGYGMDKYSASATEKIRKMTGCPEADVYYLVGGTQTNSTVIAAMLGTAEGVVAADTGHIAVHEAGAVECFGHKVLTLNSYQGKINSKELKTYLEKFHADENAPHMVYPGMVYISFPSEYGTIYSKSEIQEIYDVCKEYEIPLFIDGARLGYGLAGKGVDVTMKDIAENCDVFYIGGTKVGALFGEAVVFPRNNAPKRFYTITKTHGAMLAKGFITGVQFDTLLTDDLYMKISRYAVDMAMKVRDILEKHGIKMFLDSPTNQQFAVLPNELYKAMDGKINVSYWEEFDDNSTVVRFATSWATKKEEIEELDKVLGELTRKLRN